MGKRTMVFEDAVMGYLGITNIPTFDNPYPTQGNGTKPKGLGHACGGTKIEGCQGWFQKFAPKRVTQGKLIQMVVTEKDLAEHMCRTCKKG